MSYRAPIFLFFILLVSNGEPLYGDLDPEDLSNWVTPRELQYHSRIMISFGPHKPGDEIMVDWPRPENGTFYYKLIRIDGEPEAIFEETRELTKLKNKTIADWTVTLPDELPAKYRFGVAIKWNSHATFFVQTIIVDKINAEMWLDKEEYEIGEKPVLTIKNNGIAELAFGAGYWFEEYQDGKWKRESKIREFIMIMNLCNPDEIFDQEVDISDLKGGRYRVCKEVSIYPEQRRADLNVIGSRPLYSDVFKAEFNVRPKPPQKIFGNVIFGMFVILLVLFITLIYRKRISIRAQNRF